MDERERRSHPPYSVLVVDDETGVRKWLKYLLEQETFDVETVPTGGDAVERLESGNRTVDLVVLDIGMPGMSGFEALRAIRRLGDSPLVVVLSAHDGEEYQVRAFENGAVDYVTKPFSSAVLIARLKRHLEREFGESGGLPEPWISGEELME